MKYFSQAFDNKLILEALIGSALFCSILFVIQASYGFGWADEGLLWYASQRTFFGELPIRDFLAYDPGRYYWNCIFFFIFSDTGLYTLLIAATAFGALGLAISWYAMGSAGVSFHRRIIFAILITITLGYPRHKIYEQSLSLILIASLFMVLIRPEAFKRWLLFGIVTGLAAVFGRNHGVFFLAAALLCCFHLFFIQHAKSIPRATRWYLAGVFMGYTPIIATFILDTNFRSEFWKSILFTSNWQLPLPIPFFWRIGFNHGITYDFFHSFAIGLFCVLAPLIYIFGVIFFIFHTAGSRNYQPRIVCLLGASSLAGIPYLHQAFDRADFGHIAQSTLPVLVALAAISSLNFSSSRNRTFFRIASYVTVGIILVVWIPSQPFVKNLRLERLHPGSTVKFPVSGSDFVIEKFQADILTKVKRIADHCNISDGEFLAAPHYPGIYAYLGLKAPFWEMYYLFQRPIQFQREHINAIRHVRLILMAPEATVDGLERLKLRNTYSILLSHIEKNYQKLPIGANPYGIYLYIDPKKCTL